MAVSVNWGGGSFVVGVFRQRSLLLGVCIRAPEVLETPRLAMRTLHRIPNCQTKATVDEEILHDFIHQNIPRPYHGSIIHIHIYTYICYLSIYLSIYLYTDMEL